MFIGFEEIWTVSTVVRCKRGLFDPLDC